MLHLLCLTSAARFSGNAFCSKLKSSVSPCKWTIIKQNVMYMLWWQELLGCHASRAQARSCVLHAQAFCIVNAQFVFVSNGFILMQWSHLGESHCMQSMIVRRTAEHDRPLLPYVKTWAVMKPAQVVSILQALHFSTAAMRKLLLHIVKHWYILSCKWLLQVWHHTAANIWTCKCLQQQYVQSTQPAKHALLVLHLVCNACACIYSLSDDSCVVQTLIQKSACAA